MIMTVSKGFTPLAIVAAIKSLEVKPIARERNFARVPVKTGAKVQPMNQPIRFPRRLALVLLLAFTPLMNVGTAQESGKAEKEEDSRFVRLLSEGKEPSALQTSITTFQSTKDKRLVVDLIGAIHVGEESYFRQLNEQFTKYDAVLYELVAPKGTKIPKGGTAPSSPVSYMQNGMTEALGLAFQLDSIDYNAKNFVHADMTPEEFSNSMKKREESLGKMFFRAIGQSLVKSASGSSSSDVILMQALMTKETEDRQFKLKRALAEQFADLDGAMLVFDGPDGSTLVTERNKKALKVLTEEIKSGSLRIGIFYGAGHMKDIAKRLESEFSMTRTDTSWLTAWNLKNSSPPGEK